MTLLQELNEGRMPSSVIKSKEKLTQMAYDDPEGLVKRFEELATQGGRIHKGKTPKEIALATQWRHGYGKDNMHGPYIEAFK